MELHGTLVEGIEGAREGGREGGREEGRSMVSGNDKLERLSFSIS